LLLVIASPFIFFVSKDPKKENAILISPDALRTSVTHATDFKTLPQNANFQGKHCQIQGTNLK
jgi:hypothetical protein